MARNFFRIFTENNPVMGYSKTFFIPEAKGLKVPQFLKPKEKNIDRYIILRVGSQGPTGHDILPVLHNPSIEWASNLCCTEKFEDIHFMINSSAHEFPLSDTDVSRDSVIYHWPTYCVTKTDHLPCLLLVTGS